MPYDRPSSKLTDYGDLFLPEEAQEPILARPVRQALTEWLTEIFAETELAAIGVPPRKKAIFDGPPGVGKTTLAHHLAARLGLPMLAVRPERIIDCWVGSTGRNIGGLFDAARNGLADPRSADGVVPVMLFLDEFDALGAERRRAQQGADQHRNEAVDTLLQRIEQHDGFVIAATNHGAAIDPAIWRRFHIHIELALPGEEERERIFARYIAPFALPPAALKEMAVALGEASPALIRALCENLKRQVVVGPKLRLSADKRDVVDRVLAACHPHPDLGKPRLWSLGGKDRAVELLPWPMPRIGDAAPPEAAPADVGKVLAFARP